MPANEYITDGTAETPVAQVPDNSLEGGVPISTPAPVADPPATDATGASTPPVEGQTPAEGTQTPVSTPDELAAASERLSQQNAQQSKLLIALGLDPNSDMADQLEKGVITPEQVRNHMIGNMGIVPAPLAPVPVAPTATDPVTEATARLEAAKTAYNTEAKEGGVSLPTNSEYMDAIQGLNEANLNAVTQQVTARDTAQQADQNVNAVLSAARSSEHYEGMPTELQGDVDMLSIGLTGIIADREAQQLGLNPANLNANQVSYFANKAQAMLGKMFDHAVAIGEARVRDGFRPPVNQPGTPPVTPIGPSGNAIPTMNPYLNVNVENHAQAARNYMAGGGKPI